MPALSPADIGQLGIGPLLVLPLVRRQLLLPLSLRRLGRVPVPLEMRPSLGLRLDPPSGGPTALCLVVTEVRHGHGPRQGARSEGLDILRAHERGRSERRSLATRGEKTLQRGDVSVQFLRAAQGLRLPVLAVVLDRSPLIGTCLLRFLPLPSGFGLQLALLLPLHLGPDADRATGASTHVLQALPKALRLSPQPVVKGRLYRPIPISHIYSSKADGSRAPSVR